MMRTLFKFGNSEKVLFVSNKIDDKMSILGVDYYYNDYYCFCDCINELSSLSEFFKINDEHFLIYLNKCGGYYDIDNGLCYLQNNQIEKFISIFEPLFIMNRLCNV